MTIQTVGYSRKPFHVDAVQVTTENIQEVAAWCKGEVLSTFKTVKGSEDSKKTSVDYVKVDVNRPLNDRQTKAFVGDWVLESESGFKVYTERAFDKSFDKEVTYTEGDALAQLAGAVDKPVTAKLGGKKVKISEVFDDGRERFPEGTTVYTEADAKAQLEDDDELEAAMTR